MNCSASKKNNISHKPDIYIITGHMVFTYEHFRKSVFVQVVEFQ